MGPWPCFCVGQAKHHAIVMLRFALGMVCSPLLSALVREFSPVPQDKPPSRQILVLGLDGAGKTSVLHSLATNHVKHSAAPTEGFNAVCINTEETQLYFLESKCMDSTLGSEESFWISQELVTKTVGVSSLF